MFKIQQINNATQVLKDPFEELELHAQSLFCYIRDNSKAGLEEHMELVNSIQDAAEDMFKQVHLYRDIDDHGVKTECYHKLCDGLTKTATKLKELDAAIPTVNGSRTFQPSVYRSQFENLRAEYGKVSEIMIDACIQHVVKG